MGGTRYPEIIDLDQQELAARTRKAHDSLLQTKATPVEQHVFRHRNAIPLYDVGHNKRQHTIQTLLKKHEGLQLIGNHLFGVGVKDCIRNGKHAAEQITNASDKG
jgi:oxygen-dependent protoporphyrinogen oxidase